MSLDGLPEAPFVGRGADLEALRRALGAAVAGQPRLALVEGPAGIGKTTLLDRFTRAADGVRIVRCSGEEGEASVPYGVADQLLRIAGASEPDILGGQLADRDDHVAVGARLLDAVSVLERESPVLVVLDDAQWADAASLRAMLFAARRLVIDRVLLVLGVRDRERGHLPEGFLRLAAGSGGVVRLAPLDAGDLRRLGVGLGVELSSRAAERLHAHTEGNPLHATALLGELPDEAWGRPEAELPAPRTFFELIRSRLAECSPEARALVEAGALLGPGPPVSSAAAVGAVEHPLEALEEAVDAGLLAPPPAGAERRVSFSHPLARAAVREQIGPARRARLHVTAAAVAEDEDEALDHLVAAAEGPDAALATRLEASAEHAVETGAWSRAASAYLTASRLSADRGRREARLLAAAETYVGAGDFRRAEELAALVGDPANALRRDTVLARVALAHERPERAEPLLAGVWDRSGPDEPQLAGDAARGMAIVSLMELKGEQTIIWARRAISLLPSGHPWRADAEALLALGMAYAGRLEVATASVDATLAPMPEESGLPLRVVRGSLRLMDDDLPAARRDLAAAAATAERLGALDAAALGYAQVARAEFAAGDWDAAVVQCERALTIVAEIEYASARPIVRWVAAQIRAGRGDWAAADEHARRALADATGPLDRTVAAALARVLPPAARGESAPVIAALEPLAERDPRPEGLDDARSWPWHDLYLDALVDAGRLDDAAMFLRQHEARAAGRSSQSAAARIERARGRLEAAAGNPARAEEAFAEAVRAFDSVGMPFERARSELAYGQFLRRRGQRRAAAVLLRSAHDTLRALGAAPLLERCSRELAACGLTPAKRRSRHGDELTPQERSVAHLVTEGMTNRQVATELLLSVKTVEVHLTRIYAKLGVSSRAQLTARAHQDPDLAAPRGAPLTAGA